MFWWKVEIKYKDNNSELINLSLFNNGCTGIQELDENGIIAFFDSKISMENLTNFLDGLNIEYSIDKQRQENWLEEWKKNFKPVDIDNFFCIYPPWEQVNSNVNYNIIIEPNLAFGTGTHETTQLVLRFMEKLLFKGKSVFDIGSGSGILSFAASLLGADFILAIDIDKVALKYAYKNNVEYNKFDNIYFISGTVDCVKYKFNIILVNIISSIQKDILNNINRFLSNDSLVISSGILVEEDKDFSEFLISLGFTIIDKKVQNEWIAYLLQKK